MVDSLDIHVKGIVQGVGFRPFVYRLAKKYLINGWVLNATDGVHIHAEGESKLLDEFVMEISENSPAAAQVTEIEMKEVPLEPFDTFEIRFSEDEAVEETTLVSPDLATCGDCERELFDPNDHRYRYPFINCTNCGPRFTIIDSLPYDRANTSMNEFTMCEDCQHEYDNPADRRFHAQPNACFTCGPHIYFAVLANSETYDAPDAQSLDFSDLQVDVSWGNTREESDAIFARAVKLLLEGGILAVKGLGGFHLVCDANNAEAVAKLRERKHREGKPFAVMMHTLDDVREICEVGIEEAAVLSGAARPIVLLRKQIDAQFAPGLADRLTELGVMLPYTPAQHILLHDFAAAYKEASHNGVLAQNPPMLVMTSGNMHDEPIVIDDEDAFRRLSGIADAFIGNDRKILTRFDDSVVRIIRAGSAGESMQMIRRARGYAPTPIPFKNDFSTNDNVGTARCLDDNVGTALYALSARDDDEDHDPVIFATGPEQKNTFAFLRGDEVFVSQHIGDMENADAFEAWINAKKRYEQLFELKADELACDMHPEYITSKWAHEQSALHKPPLALAEIQHHHAHIASVIAENRFPADEAICGIAFDGTGFGVDGNIWGGEVLLSNLSDFERFLNFAYVPMPGGAAAIKNPLQMAYGMLWEFDLLEHPAAKQALAILGEDKLQMLETMIDQGINTPVTSSVGRLFDAASAILGVCTEPAYEGEPAILLEAAMGDDSASDGDDGYHIEIVKNVATDTSTAQDTSVMLFDAAPLFKAMLDDMEAEVSISVISRRFHNAFVDAIVQAAQLSLALYDIRKVALSGGVFMNRYIIEHALEALEQAGFIVAINRELPPNDGSVSYGQAVIAYARQENKNE